MGLGAQMGRVVLPRAISESFESRCWFTDYCLKIFPPMQVGVSDCYYGQNDPAFVVQFLRPQTIWVSSITISCEE